MNFDKLIELLKNLNVLYVEKDRDGSAEEPWWYQVGAIEDALGVPRGTIRDCVPEEGDE